MLLHRFSGLEGDTRIITTRNSTPSTRSSKGTGGLSSAQHASIPRPVQPVPPHRTCSCSPPPVGLENYEEVPIHEPDFNRQPVRSALKGAKLSEQLHLQLEQKLKEKRQMLDGAEEGSTRGSSLTPSGGGEGRRSAPPAVAPKPGHRLKAA